jgi:hypothetical protein
VTNSRLDFAEEKAFHCFTLTQRGDQGIGSFREVHGSIVV